MNKTIAALAAVALAACASTPAQIAGRVAYINGHVWNGGRFVPGVLVTEGGVFVDAPASSAAQSVDLSGAYVVPPYCEAHNHNIGSSPDATWGIGLYVERGIYYVKIAGNAALYRPSIAPALNRAGSVDVSFSNASFTGPGGHPTELPPQLRARHGLYTDIPEFEGAIYYQIGSAADVDRAMPLFFATDPDFVKIQLLYSDEYERRMSDDQFIGQRGLRPDLARMIVERSHARGLRVSAHVETAADWRTAIDIGVDEIYHMPSYNAPRRLTRDDAERAAAAGVGVVTTLSFASVYREQHPAHFERVREAQRENLRLLRDAGVNLIVGSDNPQATSLEEVLYLRDLAVLSDADLIDMWTTRCARSVFPNRRVGVLAPSYEASFLVLEGDPLADFSQTQAIRLRVREGERTLTAETTAKENAAGADPDGVSVQMERND